LTLERLSDYVRSMKLKAVSLLLLIPLLSCLASANENEGGMWLPSQIPERATELKELGLRVDPSKFVDFGNYPLGAIVNLNGCSASFVSADGLIISNHHCAIRSLQFNSDAVHNFLVDGFLAKNRNDEKWNGPGTRALVVTDFKDVTEEVRKGIEEVTDDLERKKTVDNRIKKLTAACEAAHEGSRCQISAYFEGQKFYQMEQLELKDIRLVYAPHGSIGNFGGAIDNWHWPRHDADFSFLRAYVDKNGKPAEYSKENIPYHPKQFLKMASSPLKSDDFVMVAGFPGRTHRLKIADEAKEATEWTYPRALRRNTEYMELIDLVTKDNPDLTVKAAGKRFGLDNYRINFEAMASQLKDWGVTKAKEDFETKLKGWIASDKTREKKYQGVFARLAAIRAEYYKTRDLDTSIREIHTFGSALTTAAVNIVRMAEERKKPDEEREIEFQKRNWPFLLAQLADAAKYYDPRLDGAYLKLSLKRAFEIGAQGHGLVQTMLGTKKNISSANVEKNLSALYKTTKFGNADYLKSLFEKTTTAELAKNKDPFVKLGMRLAPLVKQAEDRDKRYAGAMLLAAPRYVEALKDFKNKPIAPDANSSLRITFGTVKGYRPNDSKPVYKPFSTVTEMLAKVGAFPFDAPQRIIDAAKTKKFGDYFSKELGDLPVDFLADLDITGGNSGSATLNAKGELVGLVFDGVYESIASDWEFNPPVTRSIHVDLRYVLWIADRVDHATNVLSELGVKPI
jgi:hypothetical protein